MIIAGYKTRNTLVVTVTAFLLMLLITGSGFMEAWQAIAIQLTYVLYIFFLLKFEHQNGFALDVKKA